MKKRKIVCMVFAILMLVGSCQVYAYDSSSSNMNEQFYYDLASLINEQDDSNYFSEMSLSIGSNVMYIDGEWVFLDAAPEISGNRTMLPIRAIAEAVGATVDYDSVSRSAVIACDGNQIVCPIGTNSMTVNDQTYTLDVSSYVKNGRTYLPVRAVSEALELDVDWNQQNSSIQITAPYQSARLLVMTNQLNTNGLGATRVLNDGSGIWVLQFKSPTDARVAADYLSSRGYTVEPDTYRPFIDEEIEVGFDDIFTAHYSWGAIDCAFDDFINKCATLFTSTGVVAVVDTGVDATHPFLRGRVLQGMDFFDNDDDPRDEQYHGTHVAATIIDCAKTAPVSILPVRVLGSDGIGYSSMVAEGIKYAADRGADVVNLSLGGGHTESQDAAIDYAVRKGTLVAIAAGNDNEDTSNECPAHVTTPGTLIVSAGDNYHNKAGFSNFGANVDVMAPGVRVKAAVPGGGYSFLSGTSMATPHVAAAAVLLDMAWGKELSPAELEQKVHTATTRDTRTDNYSGYGFLTMKNADVPIEDTPEPAPEPSPVQPEPEPDPEPEPEKPAYTLRIMYNTNGGDIGSNTYTEGSDGMVLKGSATVTAEWPLGYGHENGLYNADTFGLWRKGYTFLGWSRTSSAGANDRVFGEDERIKAEDIYPDLRNGNASITLYAVWEKSTHTLTIKYNTNGGTVSGNKQYWANKQGSIQTDYGDVVAEWPEGYGHDKGLYNAATFGLSRNGYEFAGWSLSKDGSSRVFGEEERIMAEDIYPKVKNDDATVVLYAVWRQKNHTLGIKYNCNGGYINSNTYKKNMWGTVQQGSSDVVAWWDYGYGHPNGLYNAKTFGLYRNGYNFMGWSMSKYGTERIFGEDEKIKAEDIYPDLKNGDKTITLYAIWEPYHTLTIRYNANGGSINSNTYRKAPDGSIQKDSKTVEAY